MTHSLRETYIKTYYFFKVSFGIFDSVKLLVLYVHLRDELHVVYMQLLRDPFSRVYKCCHGGGMDDVYEDPN